MKTYEVTPDFDNTAKINTQNKKVAQNLLLQEYQKEITKERNKHRNLRVIEQDVLTTHDQGCVICMPEDWLQNFIKVFDASKKKQEEGAASPSEKKEEQQSVPREQFLVNILENDWFEPRLDEVVRVSVDGENESLD